MSLGTAIRYLEHGKWQQAHEIVQADESVLGCWAHGIVHMLEGDMQNARYWYRRAHRPFPQVGDVSPELAALSKAWNEDREAERS